MQQCTHIGLNYSAKFSHLIKTKTKRWFKTRIAYYPNSVATFNFNALTISLRGDVHPLPGPISRSTCKILVRCTDRKKRTTSCSRTCDELNCINMYMSALCKDLRDSIVLQENITDLPTLVDKYETELRRVLDIHAPEKKRAITVRPAAAWYNGDTDREKRKRRKLEGAGANHAWLLTENYTKNNVKSSVLLSRQQRKTITPT